MFEVYKMSQANERFTLSKYVLKIPFPVSFSLSIDKTN